MFLSQTYIREENYNDIKENKARLQSLNNHTELNVVKKVLVVHGGEVQ